METIDLDQPGRRSHRIAAVGLLIASVAIMHWATPTSNHQLHAVHIMLGKLFVVPVVLAAIWFDFRGAICAALAVSVLYVPHVWFQWAGQTGENLNQAGEVVSIWAVGLLAAGFVRLEKRALRQAAETQRGALIALVAALDAREHQTELHSWRVRAYGLRIARELKMAAKDVRLLEQAALLHDVGKVGTPDHILLKAGALSPEERQVMQEHSATGRRILSHVPALREVANVVYSHHERWDGTGYPRGLRGPEIPLAARVFAVADVFDALTHDRPYHRAIGLDAAADEIRCGAGSQFDPAIVEAFLNIPRQEWRRIDSQASRDRHVGAPA